ncbi:MAG: 23S rRNA (uracil(1939)-C(5))-methyltransferase RlmD [Bacteroidia bacterium]|nr:23S rRNA (uracil(1939)-C(5))-methyltransferase RlmD [Bacteroidia bacterium]
MRISRLEQQTVVDLAADGYGVLRPANAPAVLVPFTIEGEVVDVQITRSKRQLWYGEAESWHQVSPHRIEPACRDFGRCGGCRWQMMTYPHQLHHKRRFVEQALRHIGRLSVEVPPVIPSPQIWHYRNKAEYAFGQTPSGEIALGFHPRGEFAQVLPINECQIVPRLFEEIRQGVLQAAQRLNLPPYNPKTHQGLLRSLLVRGTEKEAIALLSLSEDRPDLVEALFAPIQHLLKGYGYFHNPKKNDSLHDLTPYPIAGELSLEYQIAGRRYRIGPKDFFQVNLSQAENLLQWIRQQLPSKVQVLYDLYGGVGLFGIGLADRAETVYLIEKLPEAVRSAAQNFQLNAHHYPRTSWHTIEGVVENLLPTYAKEAEGGIAIIDPPREGLHPKLRRSLLRSSFSQIVYVSCHPATQARDLAELNAAYEVVAVQPFDLFPHTTGIENVVILRRR